MRTRVVDAACPPGGLCCVELLLHGALPGLYYGAGCHPSRTTALLLALTEAAQSRLGHIAGSRDDLFRRSYLGVTEWPSTEEPARVTVALRDIPTLPVHGWSSVLHDLISRVRRLTGMPPMAVDLRREEFGLPVVQVVAPGLQLLPPSRR